MEAEAYGCLSPARKPVLEKIVGNSVNAIAVRSAQRELTVDVERRKKGQQLAQQNKDYAERVSRDPLEEVVQLSKKELAKRI